MIKIAQSIAIVAALVALQPASAQAGRFAEMRAIKQAGLTGRYQEVRREEKAARKDGSGLLRTMKTALGSAALSGGATAAFAHFGSSHLAWNAPALIQPSIQIALVAGAGFGALKLVGEGVHKIRKSFAISKAARQRVLAEAGLRMMR